MTRSFSNAFLGKVKIEGESYEYTIDPDCVVCQATKSGESNGNDNLVKKISLRPEIDRYLITVGRSYKSKQFTEKMKKKYKGVAFTRRTLERHVELHSPYILEVRQKIKDTIAAQAEPVVEDIIEKHYEAEEVIQKIINKAGQGLDDGSIKVDTKLINTALKEQGVRQKYGTLTQMLESMDQDRFSIPKREQNKISGENNSKKLIDGEVITNESAKSTSDISRELD